MTTPIPAQDENCEEFPRRPLVFGSSRRQLLASLAINYRVAEGEAEGGVGYRLAPLGSMTDEELAPIVPVVRPDCRITLGDDCVLAVLPEKAGPVRLFAWGPAPLAAFNRMNGLTPLSRIGPELAAEMGWPPERGFAYARGLFLHLVQLRVCLPRTPGMP